MAVELNRLYNEIYSKYNVELQTDSCFGKKISWLHILENLEFAKFLYGEELILNSSLNSATEIERKNYIDQLLVHEAGGLIVSLQKEHPFSQELIDYCNEKQFPVLTSSWETPFINLTRIFSKILIDNERADMDLIAAFKNALHHPDDTALYASHFEKHQFPLEGDYVVSVIVPAKNELSTFEDQLNRIEKNLQNTLEQCVIFYEDNILVVLTYNYSTETLKTFFSGFANKFPYANFAIGSLEQTLSNLHLSFVNAKHTSYVCNGIFPDNPLCYKDLGIYQILAGLKNPDVLCPPFVENTLGKLIKYDQDHHSDYMTVLKDFFENDCSITQTANVTFFHPNTLKYKIKNIKEILGYDIMQNEHRAKIMLSLAILNVIEKRG